MAWGARAVTDEQCHVFLSYSRNDMAAAVNLRTQLQRCGLAVFKDDESIRAGDLWLERLQAAVDGCGASSCWSAATGCGAGSAPRRRWRLNRYFGPARRREAPADLSDPAGRDRGRRRCRLSCGCSRRRRGTAPIRCPTRCSTSIRERTIVANETARFEGCPFVGLAAYRIDQAHLFFGRQKETLDALACFFDVRPGSPPVRWLEINGNSGSGKSSLMKAGLLPLVDQGWLWPRTGYERWRRIGPMMPGERPVEMLAEGLARAFGAEMADVCRAA